MSDTITEVTTRSRSNRIKGAIGLVALLKLVRLSGASRGPGPAPPPEEADLPPLPTGGRAVSDGAEAASARPDPPAE